MPTNEVRVTKRYKIKIDGPAAAYIALADKLQMQMTGYGLDTFDSGDATGAFCALADVRAANPTTAAGMYRFNGQYYDLSIMVDVTIDYDSFQWNTRPEV